jgi:hypothetical protein
VIPDFPKPMQETSVHRIEPRFNGFHAKVLAWCLLIIVING